MHNKHFAVFVAFCIYVTGKIESYTSTLALSFLSLSVSFSCLNSMSRWMIQGLGMCPPAFFWLLNFSRPALYGDVKTEHGQNGNLDSSALSNKVSTPSSTPHILTGPSIAPLGCGPGVHNQLFVAPVTKPTQV